MKLHFAFAALLPVLSPQASALEPNPPTLRGAFEARKLAADGYWQLKSDTGLCLDVPDSNTSNGVNLVARECHDGDNQLWIIDDKGYIRSKLDYNKCIDPEGPSTANGSSVQLWDCVSDFTYQMWNMDSSGRIASKHSPGQCLDVWEQQWGGAMIMWECHGGNNQQWSQIQPISAAPGGLNHCEILRLELTAGCIGLLPNPFAVAGCMAASATLWHICFETMDNGMMATHVDTPWYEDKTLYSMLKNVDAPEEDEYNFVGATEAQMTKDFDDGKKFASDLAAQLFN